MSEFNMNMRTPNKSTLDFSVHSTCSSVKKTLFPANERSSNYSSTNASNFGGGGDFMMQAKIEHLEKERIDLTMQLHKRDEKDRDRKLKLEQLEFRLKASEDERQKAVLEAAENREQAVRAKYEAEELRSEISRLQQEIQNTNRVEAMDVWKKMTTASRALKKSEEDLIAANAAKDAFAAQCSTLSSQLEELKKQNFQLMQGLELAKGEISVLVEENQRIVQLEEDKQTLQQQFNSERRELQDTMANLQEDIQNLSKREEQLQEDLKIAQEQVKNAVTIVSNEESADDILLLKKQLFESETKRRKLHNQLQDLKGNIRVFLRCRPFLTADGDDVYQSKQTNLLLHDDKTNVTVLNPATLGTIGAKPTHQFSFDHVFTPEAKQQEVYKEVSDLVQSVLDGYRVCVFSYGQTGSGKTHTMTGNRHGDERGIIPRSVEELLRNAHTMQSQGWEVEMSISIVEIYNEDIRDLLAKPSANSKEKEKGSEKIKIGHQKGRVVVSGLTTVPIYIGNTEVSANSYDDSCAMQQFYEVFTQSMEARSTASTGMNELSSRSHLIVMIDVQATMTTSNQGTSTMTLSGGLRLCDLAGSERLDRTNTLHDATRLRETVNINKSLSCLADVFLALQNKASHVPYRNSKLTMLLQDCLSGEGKALMFVNVSPTLASSPETLCSLRFAAQVNSVELGKAQKHVQTTTVITQALAPAPVSIVSNSNNTASTASTASSAAPVTRSRRMSVMPGLNQATAVLNGNTRGSSIANVVPPPPPPQPTAAVTAQQPSFVSSFLDEPLSESTHINGFAVMTATAHKEKNVRFDTTEEGVFAPMSSVKPFSSSAVAINATTLPTSSLTARSTTTSIAAATAVTRALGTATRRTTTTTTSATTANTFSVTAAVPTMTMTSSAMPSSLLSATKTSKVSDSSLLFSSGNSFVINAASLSSSTSSASVTNKENMDQVQHNSAHAPLPSSNTFSNTSALLAGAKRDATAAAISSFTSLDSHYHTHQPHHNSSLSMPAKRLRSAANGTDGWVSNSALSQPAQRKSTWR